MTLGQEQSDNRITTSLSALRAAARRAGTRRPLEHAKLVAHMVGPTPEAVSELRQILADVPWYRPSVRCSVACYLAGLLCERGDWSAAAQVGYGYWQRKRISFLKNTTPAGLAVLWDFGLVDTPVAGELSRICGRIDRTGRELADLLSDRSRRVAVVGNSPVLLGAGQGAEIDAHDVVIRFNDFTTEPAYEADTGRKTTVWMRIRGQRKLWRRPSDSFAFVVFGGPDRRFHGPHPWDLVETDRAGGRPACVPTRIYVDLATRLDFAPSSGMIMLYWLRRLRGPLPTADVSLYGFKLDDQVDGVRHYFDKTPTDAVRHNWSAEAAFLRTAILA